MEYKAVLFDFDGVLGDTMHDNYRAWSRALHAYGMTITEKDYFFLEGLSTKGVAETLLKRDGLDLSNTAAVVALKEQHYLEDNRFRFFPGALELVAELRESSPLGLVTGSGMERLRRSTGRQFLDQFQSVVTGESLHHSKPDPEPYLLATQALGLPPAACLVIENAPLGIQAAKSAGMTCIAICSTLAAEYLQSADFIVPNLQSVRHHLNFGNRQ